MKHCSSCKFFDKNPHSEDMGVCHRYPPQLVAETTILNTGVERIYAQSLHPTVLTNSWCGEYKARSPVASRHVEPMSATEFKE